jgi:hypothetical protein
MKQINEKDEEAFNQHSYVINELRYQLSKLRERMDAIPDSEEFIICEIRNKFKDIADRVDSLYTDIYAMTK